MGDAQLISAKTLGTPWGGVFDDPWLPGHPADGDRVAIFVHVVTSVDDRSRTSAPIISRRPIGRCTGR